MPKSESKASHVDANLIEASEPEGTTGTEAETLGEFVGKHAEAQANNQEWIETSHKNMCKLMTLSKWEAQGYFCYKGVKVTTFGNIEKIEANEAKTAHDRMHPGPQPTVISG